MSHVCVYVCMYVCMHMTEFLGSCRMHVCACMYVCTGVVKTPMHTTTYMHTHIYIFICCYVACSSLQLRYPTNVSNTHTHTHTHARTHTCICICIHACTNIPVLLCSGDIQMMSQTHTRTHTRMNMHTIYVQMYLFFFAVEISNKCLKRAICKPINWRQTMCMPA
jgi:hypothetical protein